MIPAFISDDADVVAFLSDAREHLKARTFTPLPVRERMIPKPGQRGQFRRLGIPSAMDRLVQASLVLVLEPIFEADFKPVSYGFRPKRRAQDAIAEIHHFGTRGYTWAFEADIAACFDELSHTSPIVVGGVDTHKELHVAAVVDAHDVVIGSESLSTTRAGYRALLRWMRTFGDLSRVGVECTGAGAARTTPSTRSRPPTPRTPGPHRHPAGPRRDGGVGAGVEDRPPVDTDITVTLWCTLLKRLVQ